MMYIAIVILGEIKWLCCIQTVVSFSSVLEMLRCCFLVFNAIRKMVRWCSDCIKELLLTWWYARMLGHSISQVSEFVWRVWNWCVNLMRKYSSRILLEIDLLLLPKRVTVS
jgi:hypothetical protein